MAIFFTPFYTVNLFSFSAITLVIGMAVFFRIPNIRSFFKTEACLKYVSDQNFYKWKLDFVSLFQRISWDNPKSSDNQVFTWFYAINLFWASQQAHLKHLFPWNYQPFESSAQDLLPTEGNKAYCKFFARLRRWCFLKAHITIPMSPPNLSFSALVYSFRLMNLSCQVLQCISTIWLVANKLAIICTSAE